MLENIKAYSYEGFIIVETLKDDGKPSGKFLVLTGAGDYKYGPVSLEKATELILVELKKIPPPPGKGRPRP